MNKKIKVMSKEKTILRIIKNVNNVNITIRLIVCKEEKKNKLVVIFNDKKVETNIDKKFWYLYDYDAHPYYYASTKSLRANYYCEMHPIKICEKTQTINLLDKYFSMTCNVGFQKSYLL